MASKYQEEYDRAHPDALMAPHTGVFLVYPEGTKTAKYVSDIRCRATQTPLRKYIQRKKKFDDQTMNANNWQAHGKALKQQIRKRVHFTKFVPECLPTLSQLNRYNTRRRKCPCCLSIKEDRDHAHWQTSFRCRLIEMLEKGVMNPPLQSLLVTALVDWMEGEDDGMVISPALYHAD
jgi:hypothetical protein